MQVVLILGIVASALPLGLALAANRRTSLVHALGWAILAWGAWGIAVLAEPAPGRDIPPLRYCALCLTGCAGVAVLGARRPHGFAWNFVVLGLLWVMLLPLLETLLLGTPTTSGLRGIFLAATVAVGIVNYFPTRLAPAAVVLLVACEGELAPASQLGDIPTIVWQSKDAALFAVPWIAWLSWRTRGPIASDVDALWLGFRDRWGFVWGQRVREQFNNAAQNAGWNVSLGWSGLRSREGESGPRVGPEKIEETLRAVLQRFLEPSPERPET